MGGLRLSYCSKYGGGQGARNTGNFRMLGVASSWQAWRKQGSPPNNHKKPKLTKNLNELGSWFIPGISRKECNAAYMKGILQGNKNSFWSMGPLQYRLLPLSECSRSASVSVCQLALLWEAAFGFSEFFEVSFNMFAHFMMGDLWVHLPTPHQVFSTFWPKNGKGPVPQPLPIYPVLPRAIFCLSVSLDEKVLKRKLFA